MTPETALETLPVIQVKITEEEPRVIYEGAKYAFGVYREKYTGLEVIYVSEDTVNADQITWIRPEETDSLEGIDRFENLEEVVLRETEVKTLKPLLTCKKLKALTLIDNNKFQQYDELAWFRNLEYLYLDAGTNEVNLNLNFIKSMDKLIALDVEKNPITESGPFYKLKWLRVIKGETKS